MKLIPLTKGKFALIDDADLKWLQRWKWKAQLNNGYWYACAWDRETKSVILMHRLILGLKKGDKREGDHRSHNTLNNTRDNLRICTHRENAQNSHKKAKATSIYKGVSWNKTRKKWVAMLKAKGKRKTLGFYASEKKAARAYDKAAVKFFGEFAYLNFPKPDPRRSAFFGVKYD